MSITRYTYSSDGKVTALASDGYYIWVATKNTSDCRLKKVGAFDASQVYFNLTVTADEITNIKVSGSYVYLALDDSTNIGMRVSRTNPLSSYDYIAIPGGITEKGIDLALDSNSDLFIITPGEISGEDAKFIKFDGITYDSTLTLSGINNARSMTVDDSDIFWTVTYETEAKLVKIYEQSGAYTYSVEYN